MAKKLQNKAFPKNWLCSILRLYAAVTSGRKIRKVTCTDYSQNVKNLILAPFGPNASKQEFSLKNVSGQFYIFFMLLQFDAKKSGKFHALISHKTWKTSIWAHFWPLLAQKCQNKVLPNKSLGWILSLYAAVTSIKQIRKVPCLDFSLLKNLVLVPLWVTSGSKTLKLFLKKSFKSILNFYASATSSKRNQRRSMLLFFTKLEKIHFGPTLAPFGSKASKQIFSQKKSFRSILSLRAAVTEKFHALNFHKTWKISFWAHFVSLLAKKLQNKVFPPKNL